jgi:sec-independent protein translocase protein TatA
MVGLDNPLHILIVLVVVLMLFGAKKLPDMGRGIGEGMRSFKQGISGESPADHQPIGLSSAPEPVAAPAPVAAAPVAAPVATHAVERESAPIA